MTLFPVVKFENVKSIFEKSKFFGTVGEWISDVKKFHCIILTFLLSFFEFLVKFNQQILTFSKIPNILPKKKYRKISEKNTKLCKKLEILWNNFNKITQNFGKKTQMHNFAEKCRVLQKKHKFLKTSQTLVVKKQKFCNTYNIFNTQSVRIFTISKSRCDGFFQIWKANKFGFQSSYQTKFIIFFLLPGSMNLVILKKNAKICW